MKFKIIFGIIVPSVFIIILTILGSLDIGFSVKEIYPTQLSLSRDLVEGDRVKNVVKLGEVQINNNYLFPKRYDLPVLEACLIDNSKIENTIEAGTIEYSEGDYPPTDELVPYGRNSERNVEIGAYEKKSVKIYLRPSYDFLYMNLSDLSDKYRNYDEIVVYRVDNSQKGIYSYSRRGYCYNLDEETLSEATHIKLIP